MISTYVFSLEPAGVWRPPVERDQPASPGGRAALVRSDTLSAALCATAMETGVLAEAWGGPSPPIRVSSVFPEAGGVRLYPRPETLEVGAGEAAPASVDKASAWVDEAPTSVDEDSASVDEHGAAASAELDEAGGAATASVSRAGGGAKFEYVTEARLESLAEGRRVRFEPEDVALGRVWGMPSERSLAGLPERRTLTRAAVDRRGGPPDRFESAELFFPAGARVFFLARAEPALLAPLKDLVSRLGEFGLGAGRAAGRGGFTLAGAHPAPAFLAVPPAGEGPPSGDRPGLLLLSLYLPSREEAARGVLEGTAAETLVRGGWIHSGGPTQFRKKAVRMLPEGTVLRGASGAVEGEVRDVRPPGFDRHPVWRDGRALAVSYRGAP